MNFSYALSAKLLMETEGKSLWPLPKVSILQLSTMQNEMQYCHLLPGLNNISSPSVTFSWRWDHCFRTGNLLIITKMWSWLIQRSHYINTVFTAFFFNNIINNFCHTIKRIRDQKAQGVLTYSVSVFKITSKQHRLFFPLLPPPLNSQIHNS